jgi:predicted unusual protein kinase regulating ubiquinone biosynthesis (AarF/ABC1/UbiB family)
MIARRATARERRTEVRERLSRAAEAAGGVRASRRRSTSADREGGGADADRLARVLAELGPAFAAYGVYLASRGDLLGPADRRRLVALDRDVSPLPPSSVRAIVRTEAGRARTGAAPLGTASEAIAALEDQPFDARLLVQRHHGRLASGRPVVVRVVRTDRSHEADLDLVPLSRNLVAPLLSDARLFDQSIGDFRASYAAQTNGMALADALEVLARAARDVDSLRLPEVYRAISTSRVLVVERLPGRRLATCRFSADEEGDAAADDGGGDARAGSSGLARLICEQWLRLAFDAGLVSSDPRAADMLVLGRAQVAIDEGTFSILPNEIRANWLRYLVAGAIDEPRHALDSLLKEFSASRHRTSRDELERLFRQMAPDVDPDGPSDGPSGRLIATLQSQWRLVIAHGYRPLRPSLPLLRGAVRLSELVGVLAPDRDALLEGLKDYRITRLLGDVQGMLDPMYWFSRFDRIANLMMSSPRIFDEALRAAVPERGAEEGRSPNPRRRPAWGEPWLIPTLVALTMIGMAYGRGPPGAGEPWGEAIAALWFLLLGCWLLRSAVGPSP